MLRHPHPPAFLATALLVLSLPPLFGQEPADRPRVGVALSGGGGTLF